MELSSGTRISHYEIIAPIGAGGMGEVYRARDIKLKREVALKILPESFAGDSDRMFRFQREAELLASLNHSNIATIYEVEGRALAMEMVEGETLLGPLPLETVLNYARQIAEALEYAHERGIIHRDLKPANIKVTSDGVVKLLDFGLAKAVGQAAASGTTAARQGTSDSPTLTVGGTIAGVILGTAGYMSPEQASGKPVDKRADIWAFGVVLYEMLTGQRLFEGETVSHTLAAVLKDQPDLNAVPYRMRRLLRSCLEKDSKRRLQSVADWKLLLDEEPVSHQVATVPRPGNAVVAWAVAGVLAVGAAVGFWGWLKPTATEARLPMHFVEGLPLPPVGESIALSRDGSRIAYSQGRSPGGPIYVRNMDQPEFKPIPGTDGALSVAFSPDGQWLASQFPGRQVKKIQIAGGGLLTLVEEGLPNFAGAPHVSWGEDDYILFTSSSNLMRVRSSGGKPETLATADAQKGEGFAAPQLLPGGKAVLVTISDAASANARIVVLNLETHSMTTVVETAGAGRWMPSGPGSESGFIVYARSGSLYAVPFDVKRLQAGGAIPMLNGVRSIVPTQGIFTLAGNGTLAYVPGSVQSTAEGPVSTLVWVNREGREQPISVPARNYTNMRVSPDGTRVALQVQDLQGTSDVWVVDLDRGTSTRITTQKNNTFPIWSFDGKRLLYIVSNSIQARLARGNPNLNSSLVSVSADGSGETSTLIVEGPSHIPTSVSPDGKVVVGFQPTPGSSGGRGAPTDLWTLSLDSSEAKPKTFLSTPFNKTNVNFSPDGKWLAYQSNESGRPEVYVVPFPGPGGKYPVSTDGGTTPHWAPNGRELFYRMGDKMMSVSVQTGSSFSAGKPKLLFEKPVFAYDVRSDGRFLMIKAGDAAPQAEQKAELHIVLNWIEQLRRQTPAASH